MKPIIKQIALEAGGSHYPTVGGQWLEQSIHIAVRQCAQVALEHKQYNVAKAILEKFELYKNIL